MDEKRSINRQSMLDTGGSTTTPSVTSDPNPQPKKWHFGWTIVIFILAIAFMQWPTLKDLYYEVSETSPTEAMIPFPGDMTLIPL